MYFKKLIFVVSSFLNILIKNIDFHCIIVEKGKSTKLNIMDTSNKTIFKHLIFIVENNAIVAGNEVYSL